MYIVTDMESGEYEINRNGEEAYGPEVMCAGWNPSVVAMQEETARMVGQVMHLHAEHVANAIRRSTPDLAALEVEAFLQKMYVSQR
jgi:hypothetical protein